MNHTRAYCQLCEGWAVICKTCGNDSCNGGCGKLDDGTDCPDCQEAYEIMMNPPLLMELNLYERTEEEECDRLLDQMEQTPEFQTELARAIQEALSEEPKIILSTPEEIRAYIAGLSAKPISELDDPE